MEDGVDEKFPLPSWVPDWHNGLRRPYRDRHGPELLSLSARSITSVQVVPTVLQSTLGLRGFLADTIEEVGNCITKRDLSAALKDDDYGMAADLYDLMCSVKQFWHRSMENGLGIYKHVSRQNEALWRVPIQDMWDVSETEGSPTVSIRPSSELGAHTFEQALEYCRIVMSIEYQRAQHAIPDGNFVPNLSRAEEDVIRKFNDRNGMQSKYVSRVSSMLDDLELRLYLTTKGCLGWAPSHTQPGDVLVIFSGGLVPYVIRPVTIDTDRCRFKPDNAGSQAKSDTQIRAESATKVEEAAKDCHDVNFKLPESPLYTEAEIHAMYEKHRLHQSSHPPPEHVALPTRPGENDNIYTFVGEAFCDGIMDSEFMERAGEIQDFFLV